MLKTCTARSNFITPHAILVCGRLPESSCARITGRVSSDPRTGGWLCWRVIAWGMKAFAVSLRAGAEREKVNGELCVDYTEKDEKIPQQGRFGLQIHAGGPAEVWFKDITLEEL